MNRGFEEARSGSLEDGEVARGGGLEDDWVIAAECEEVHEVGAK